MKKLIRLITRSLAVSLGFLAIMIGAAQFLAPSLPRSRNVVDESVAKAAAAMRDPQIDPQNPIQIYESVDYAQGTQGSWYPKGESPLLKQLVETGQLPPVAQRVGPEPAVFRGIDGIGNYGGSWLSVASGSSDIGGFLRYNIRSTALVRYSPNGYPIVPGLAKAFEVNEDSTVFTFHLRRGVRWSDGEPFTADDILFWWEYWAQWEDPQTHNKIGYIPETMKIKGQYGTIRKLDDYTVQYSFPHTNAIFLEYMASARGVLYTALPAHFLKPYHPAFADRQFIEQLKTQHQLSSDKAVFDWASDLINPLRPSLSPWIVRTERSSGPYTLIRNPYYWAVDTQGNQLPYLDRVVFQIKNPGVQNLSLTNGEATFQQGRFADYTMLMSQQNQGDYDVLHWYPSRRSDLAVFPNINLKIEKDQPQTQWKHDILNDVRFRKALSLSINRQRIIDAEWAGVGKPSQIEPGPASVYHSQKLADSYIAYTPQQANDLLDAMDLKQRDAEGYRTFANGQRMTFFMITGTGQDITRICQFILEDWEQIGIRVMLLERPGRLYQIEKFGRTADLIVASDSSSHNPLTGGIFFPDNAHCSYASAFGKWYGNEGMIRPTDKGIEPPMDHPLRQIMRLFEKACSLSDPLARAKVFEQALELFANNVYAISIATPPPQIFVRKRGLMNVPALAISSFVDYRTPNNAVPEMWYLEKTNQNDADRSSILNEITHITQRNPVAQQASSTALQTTGKGHTLATMIKWVVLLSVILLLGLIAIRHPFVIRRVVIMIPTMLVISIIVFVMIQLPPGDYLTSRINQLQLDGMNVSDQEIAQLRERFNLDDSMPMRYLKWMGLDYLRTWDKADTGLLQGNLGISMSEMKPVNEIIGDRILLTMLISAGTIILTWFLALPIGIYSAVKQYSPADYVLTFLGFIGMCVPQFLLALIMIYLSGKYFGIHVSGLFSVEYAIAPVWTWGKVLDLLKHIWVPILVLGVGGTAGMIRIMRANLLDELKKPYVTTARAKGVGPIKLLLKYPVRMALNPFISGIGGIFPELISGGAIVAMVLSLPTVGPLLIEAVMIEDTQLAGSMLMVLSMLGVFGVLVSDLLLIAVDPRIRLGNKG